MRWMLVARYLLREKYTSARVCDRLPLYEALSHLQSLVSQVRLARGVESPCHQEASAQVPRKKAHHVS